MPEPKVKTASSIGRTNKARGKEQERELATILAEVWPGAKRGLQDRSGAEVPDVEGTPFWWEAKAYNAHGCVRHLRQAEAATDGRVPVVALREMKDPRWIVMLRLDDLPKFLAQLPAEMQVRMAEAIRKERKLAREATS